MLRTVLRTVLPLLLLLTFGCAKFADRKLNGVTIKPPYAPSPYTAEFHKTLTVIDLHADQLLWDRDLLQRSDHGHVDLPRLQEGNVALQVFGVVTGFPLFPGMDNNKDSSDAITTLVKLQDWPGETYTSRFERARYQAKKLAERITASQGGLMWITKRGDIDSLLAARARGKQVIGALLSLEGTHALEGDPGRIDLLYDLGFRMLGLVHLFDTDMAGSAQGEAKYGLTDKGKQLVRRALDRGMIIDLAHASGKTIDDIVAMADRPVISSHGGVKGTCNTARNLSDSHIKAIAATGGLIGIGLYEYATCGTTLEDTVKAMRHAADLVGVSHVALGSDFDGATTTTVDASGLALLTSALLHGGFSRDDVAAIMGGNALRVLRRTLPMD